MDKFLLVFYNEDREKKYNDSAKPLVSLTFLVNVTLIALIQLGYLVFILSNSSAIQTWAFVLALIILAVLSASLVLKFPRKMGIVVSSFKLTFIITSIEFLRWTKSDIRPEEAFYYGCSFTAFTHILGMGPSPAGFISSTFFEVITTMYIASLFVNELSRSTVPFVFFTLINLFLNVSSRYHFEKFIRRLFLQKEKNQKQVDAYKYMVREALPGFSMIINEKSSRGLNSLVKATKTEKSVFTKAKNLFRKKVKEVNKEEDEALSTNRRNLVLEEDKSSNKYNVDSESMARTNQSMKNILLGQCSLYAGVEYSNEKAKRLFNINNSIELLNFLESIQITQYQFPKPDIYYENQENLEKKNALEIINTVFEEDELYEKKFKNFSFKLRRQESKVQESSPYSKTVIKGYLPKPHDEKMYIEIKLCKFHIGKRPGIFILLDDISAEEENKILKSLDNFKDRLLANVTHDLRTPLNGILFMIEKARSLAETKVPEIMQDLNFAIINAKLLNNLICDILDYSLFKEKKLRLTCEDFFIDDTIRDVIDLISFQAQHKGVELILSNECESDLVMNADERRIKQVLINLLGNSLKFTPEGGKILLRLVQLQQRPEILMFEVMDTGCGMTDKVLENLFKPFSTANLNGMNDRGIGLGLTICKEIVSQTGPFNEIFVSTIRSLGTKFTFFLFKEIKLTSGSTATIFKRNSSFDLEYGRPSATTKKRKLSQLTLEMLQNEVTPFDIDYFNNNHLKKNILTSQEYSSVYSLSSLSKKNHKNFSKMLGDETATLAAGIKNPFISFPSNEAKIRSNIDEKMMKLLESPKNGEGDIHTGEFSTVEIQLMQQQNIFSPLFKQNSFNVRFSSGMRRFSRFKENPEGQNNKIPLNVLIVDDNMFNIIILENLLKKLLNFNAVPYSAVDGKKAIEIFESKNSDSDENLDPIDIMLLDVNMPITNGYEVSKTINEKINNGYRRCYIIACTSYNAKGEKKKCKEQGMDDFIEKPISVDSINRLFDKFFLDSKH